MADINSLNFDVILNSAKFEKDLKRTQELAEKFDKSVREALSVTKSLNAELGKNISDAKAKAKVQQTTEKLTQQELQAKKAAGTLTAAEAKQLNRLLAVEKKSLDIKNKELAVAAKQEAAIRRQEQATQKRAQAERAVQQAVTVSSEKLTQQGRVVSELGSLVSTYVSVLGAVSLVRNMVRITGEFEAQHAALQAILQDTSAADKIFNQLQSLAVVSPYTFQDLVSYAKQLTAFSTPANELYDTTKRLADVAAGLGVDMGRIILAFGQVRSAEFLRGCLGKGTLVKTGRGVIPVEDVVVGDVLYNDNNERVNVLELIRGHEQMYLVKQSNGIDYRVNENHILTCKKGLDIFDVYVKNWADDYEGVKYTEDGLVSYQISIEEDIVDDYYGFVLDGNKRFQLGDGTITHNTEVRQFTEAGIPILSEIAEQFSEIEGRAVAVGEVFDRISARQVPFEMVAESFNRMTSAGGKFYNMQEVLAETVKGKISNLQDSWEIMLSKIGDENSGTIKGFVEWLTSLLSNYKSWLSVLGAVVKYLGIYNGLLLASNTIMGLANAFAQMRNILDTLQNKNLKLMTALLPTKTALAKIDVKTTEEAIAAETALNAVRKVALGGISLIATAIWTMVQRSREAREEANKVTNTINASLSKLNLMMAEFDLYAKRVTDAFVALKAAEGDNAEETKKFEQAVTDLKARFPKFIDDHIRLAETVDDLGQYWAKARAEMNQYYAEETKESLHGDLTQNRDENIADLSKRFTRHIQSYFSRQDKATLGKEYSTLAWRYVTGEVGRDEVTPIAQKMSDYYSERMGDSWNYSPGILKDFDAFVNEYNAIVKRYDESLQQMEDMLAKHNLTTTRSIYNEYLFSLTGAKTPWTIGDETKSFSAWSEAGQKKIMQSWAGGSGKDIAFQLGDTVKSWAERQREQLKSGKVSDEVKSVIRQAFDQFGILEDPNAITGWRKEVNDLIDNFDGILRKALEGMDGMSDEAISAFVQKHGKTGGKFKVKATSQLEEVLEEYTENLDSAQGFLKRLPKSMSNLQNDEYASTWVTQLLLQSISKALYGDDVLDFGGSKEKGKQRTTGNGHQEEIAALKQDFQNLKKLKAAYAEFRSLGFEEGQSGKLLNYFFGRGLPGGGFDTAFENVAKKLEKYSPNDAQDVRNFASGKDVDAFGEKVEAAQKATKSFGKALTEFQATTKRLNLDGFSAEIDKILVETNAKNQKLQTEWGEKEKELEAAKDGWIAQYRVQNETATIEQAQTAWAEFYKGQKDAVKASVDAQVAYNNKLAQMSVDGKADAWVSTMLEREDISLSDWSDKTPEQIDALKAKLTSLKENLATLIPEELRSDAEAVNVTFTELLNAIDSILAKKIETTDIERAKKALEQMTKSLQTVASYLGTLGDSISSLGGGWESVGGAISNAGKQLASYADINQKLKSGQMTQKAANLSAYMMVGSYLLSSTADIISNFKEMKAATEAWQLELKKAGYELVNLKLEALGYEQANVFGVEDPYSKALASSKQLKASQEELLKLTDSLSKIKVKVDEKEVADAFSVVSGAIEGATVGLVAGSIVPVIGTVVGTAVGAVFGTIKGWFSGKKKKDIEMSLGQLTSGRLFDPETLELADEVIAKYDQLDDAGKALVDHWNEIKETMREALDTFNQNIEDVVDDMASSIKDILINAFNDGDVYDAIDDLHDYIGNTLQDLMVEIAFSSALQPVFEKLSARMRHSFGLDENGNPLEKLDDDVDYDWVDDIADFDDELNSSFGALQAALEAAKKSLSGSGYSWDSGEEEDSTLSSGIKSVTEDTANLLASYLNAIRADVSYGRILWERIAVAAEAQANGGGYITLNDYLNQVAANTFDTAQNTKRILTRIESVIGAEGSSGSIVRVQVS